MRYILIVLLMFGLLTSPAAAQEASSGILHTRDNVNIAYERYRIGSDTVIIICPGFFNSKNSRWMRKIAELVSSKYDVIIFDFRGHGQSSGKFTWSAKEDMDVDAVLDYAKSCGYKQIGIVAFSLGAAAAVNAVADRDSVKSMVLISCPYKIRKIDFHFWEPEMFDDLKDNIECKWEGKGARWGSIFLAKKDPIDSIKNIKNAAMLFIHGDKDWIIKSRHSKKLYDAADTYKDLEIIKGGLHAERLVQFHPDMMKELILKWFSKTLVYDRGFAVYSKK